VAQRTRTKAASAPKVESPPEPSALSLVPEAPAPAVDLAVALDPACSALLGVEPVLADWEQSYLQRLASPKLRAVLDALTLPLDTRALELRKRGLGAYRHGWFEEAYEDLTEAATLNRYDFTVHQVLGNLALVHLMDPDAAAGHFARAARYAAPLSPADAALAHVSLAAVAEVRGMPEMALTHAWDALAACETSAEASYAAAKYLAVTGAADSEIAACLDVAVRRNVRLCALAENDPSFATCRETVARVVGDLKDSLLSCAAERRRGLAATTHVLRSAAGKWNDPRLTPLIQRAAALQSTLAFTADADTARVAEALGVARRDARELINTSASVVREISANAAAREQGSRSDAESRSTEIACNWFLYAILGCLACVGFLALIVVLGLLAGGDLLTAAFWLLPVAGIGGLFGGFAANRWMAQRELGQALDLSDVRAALEAAASELEGLREIVAAGVRSLGASSAEIAPA